MQHILLKLTPAVMISATNLSEYGELGMPKKSIRASKASMNPIQACLYDSPKVYAVRSSCQFELDHWIQGGRAMAPAIL
jgi:hypothetical protein